MFVVLQALAPPVGFVVIRAFPASSTATHRGAATQEIPARACVLSMLALAQVPPVTEGTCGVGALEVAALPALSTAAQRVGVAQEMPVRWCVPSMFVDVH
jgi:hypothetical protein